MAFYSLPDVDTLQAGVGELARQLSRMGWHAPGFGGSSSWSVSVLVFVLAFASIQLIEFLASFEQVQAVDDQLSSKSKVSVQAKEVHRLPNSSDIRLRIIIVLVVTLPVSHLHLTGI